MKLYLAGPMRGIPYYNFPEFDRWAALLRDAGHEVISPAEIDRAHGDEPDPAGRFEAIDFRECMARDLPLLVKCDAIALLPGWMSSQGARLEYEVMKGVGGFVYRLYYPQHLKYLLGPRYDPSLVN